MPLPFSTRIVVLDDPVLAFVDRSQGRYRLFEDHWRGIEWRLARAPENGTPRDYLDPTNHLVDVIPANPKAGTDKVWLLYSYTEDQTFIHWAQFGSGPTVT